MNDTNQNLLQEHTDILSLRDLGHTKTITSFHPDAQYARLTDTYCCP